MVGNWYVPRGRGCSQSGLGAFPNKAALLFSQAASCDYHHIVTCQYFAEQIHEIYLRVEIGHQNKADKFINASSCAVRGGRRRLETQLLPRSPVVVLAELLHIVTD